MLNLKLCSYVETYEEFKATNIRPAIEYYKNWHPIRSEWVLFTKGMYSVNGKIYNGKI